MHQIPSFDDWYKEKHGETFSKKNEQSGQFIADSMKELSKSLGEYVTEMMRSKQENSQGTWIN